MQKSFVSLLVLVAFALPALCELPTAGPGDPKITYARVAKNPDKFRGKRVVWPGWAPTVDGRTALVYGGSDDECAAGIYKRYVVRFTFEKDADTVFRSGSGKFTATVAGKITITYPDPDDPFFQEKTEIVPLLVHPRFATK